MGQAVDSITELLRRDDGDDFKFTSNAAVTEVPATDAASNWKNASGNQFFNSGEGVILKSVIIALPYSFGFGTGCVSLDLVYRLDGGGDQNITNLGGGAPLLYPPQCCELPLDVYIPPVVPASGSPPAGGVRWAFGSRGNGAFNVSMINLPAALDATLFNACVFLKVKHTQPMT